MTDPRVELTGLAAGPAAGQVLDELDRVQVVLELAPGRGEHEQDVVGLLNFVNIAARIFPHWDMELASGLACSAPLFGGGELADVLDGLARRVAPQATRSPDRRYTVAWGADPSAPGLALDARGWSCSLGPSHLPLPEAGGPALGALAVGDWAVGQMLFAALGSLGLSGHASDGFRWNLLDYQLQPAPVDAAVEPRLPALTNAGCGSVGSSLIYSALLAHAGGGPVALVDPDSFTERNTLRYPILTDSTNTASKAAWLAELCLANGIAATGHPHDVADYTNSFESPPCIDLAIVSVDTLSGRRDATDLLAGTTLNIGVSGLSLQVARHAFGPGGCAYCQYVELAPSTSGAEALAAVIGLPVERVLAIEQGDGRITEPDAATLAAAGRYRADPPEAGQRLADVRRRAYAQASIPTDNGDLRVSAPHVSGLAGVVALGEAIKHATGELHPFRLQGRLALDLSGQPSGFSLGASVDQSGRCLCHSAFRRRAWTALHGEPGQP